MLTAVPEMLKEHMTTAFEGSAQHADWKVWSESGLAATSPAGVGLTP